MCNPNSGSRTYSTPPDFRNGKRRRQSREFYGSYAELDISAVVLYTRYYSRLLSPIGSELEAHAVRSPPLFPAASGGMELKIFLLPGFNLLSTKQVLILVCCEMALEDPSLARKVLGTDSPVLFQLASSRPYPDSSGNVAVAALEMSLFPPRGMCLVRYSLAIYLGIHSCVFPTIRVLGNPHVVGLTIPSHLFW